MNDLKFTLTGEIPSKKNNKEIIWARGRRMLVSSNRYQKWEKVAVLDLRAQLTRQKAHPRGPGHINSVEMSFWMKDERRRDLSNAAEGLMDSLVKAGVILDDSWRMVPTVFLHAEGVDKENPRVEITIHFKENRPATGT